jgi:hypothetical protein
VASLKQFGVFLFSRVTRGRQRGFAVMAPFDMASRGVRGEATLDCLLTAYVQYVSGTCDSKFCLVLAQCSLPLHGNATQKYAVSYHVHLAVYSPRAHYAWDYIQPEVSATQSLSVLPYCSMHTLDPPWLPRDLISGNAPTLPVLLAMH